MTDSWPCTEWDKSFRQKEQQLCVCYAPVHELAVLRESVGGRIQRLERLRGIMA